MYNERKTNMFDFLFLFTFLSRWIHSNKFELIDLRKNMKSTLVLSINVKLKVTRERREREKEREREREREKERERKRERGGGGGGGGETERDVLS